MPRYLRGHQSGHKTAQSYVRNPTVRISRKSNPDLYYANRAKTRRSRYRTTYGMTRRKNATRKVGNTTQKSNHSKSNLTSTYVPFNITGQKLSHATLKIIKELSRVGLAEKKVKTIIPTPLLGNGTGTTVDYVPALKFNTGNQALNSMAGVLVMFDQDINSTDLVPATGFTQPTQGAPGNVIKLDAFSLIRSPASTTQGNIGPEFTNTLIGKTMFCQGIKLALTIQLKPGLTISSLQTPPTITDEIGLYLHAWQFRIIICKERAKAKNSYNPSGYAEASLVNDILMPISGQGSQGFGTAANVPSETGQMFQTNPKDVLFGKLNFKKYKILHDSRTKISPVSYLSANTGTQQNVGFRRINLNLPVNQKLQYDTSKQTGTRTKPVDCDTNYYLMVLGGCPGMNHNFTDSASAWSLNDKFSVTCKGRMTFTDC